MALIEIDGLLYELIASWIFPWRTVSHAHNQYATLFLLHVDDVKHPNNEGYESLRYSEVTLVQRC